MASQLILVTGDYGHYKRTLSFSISLALESAIAKPTCLSSCYSGFLTVFDMAGIVYTPYAVIICL